MTKWMNKWSPLVFQNTACIFNPDVKIVPSHQGNIQCSTNTSASLIAPNKEKYALANEALGESDSVLSASETRLLIPRPRETRRLSLHMSLSATSVKTWEYRDQRKCQVFLIFYMWENETLEMQYENYWFLTLRLLAMIPAAYYMIDIVV